MVYPALWERERSAGIGMGNDVVRPDPHRPLGSDEVGVILDSIADGVFTVDAEFRVTSFNQAAEAITGVPRDEALGRPCCEVFRASICEAQCALKETMQSGRPIVNRSVYILRPDGDRVPISVSTAILKDRQGSVLGGVETFRDLRLVEQLRAEIARRYTFADILSKNREMRRLLEMLPQVAESDNAGQNDGIQTAGRMAAHDVQVLLTGHCDPVAIRALQAAGIRVCTRLAGGTVREAVERFSAGALQEATASNAQGHC